VNGAEHIDKLRSRVVELEHFFMRSQDLLCIASFEGRFLQLNPTWEQVLNYPREELLAEPFVHFVHPEDVEATLQEMQSLATGATTLAFENRFRCPDGSYRWLQWSATPVVAEGKIYAAARDITAHKQADVEQGRLLAILDTTIDFVSTVDMRGRALYLNRAGRQMFGIAEDVDISTLKMFDLHPAWAQQVIREEGVPTALREGIWQGETALLLPSGEELPISQVITAHFAPDGSPAYLSTIGRDLREQKLAEAEQHRLQDEIIAAQAAALAELSTPLIPISDELLVMPLIGSIDSQRTQQVLDILLNGVAASRARVVILDITGVPVVDTQVANGLIRAAQAVKLLGAQAVLTGIRPEVAQTLVGLGVDLGEVVAHGTLQSGIAFAIGKR
jgi:rsbT co-antagonist protein RsbR